MKNAFFKRMDLGATRKILDSIHDGTLARVPKTTSPIFGLQVPRSCPGLADADLRTEDTWSSKVRF